MTESASDDLGYCFGVQLETGNYAVLPQSESTIAAVARGAPAERKLVARLKKLFNRRRYKALRPIYGVDSGDLEQTGWALVFPRGDSTELQQRLRPLISRRRDASGKYFRIVDGDNGIGPNESVASFLGRFDVGTGAVDPRRLPYYLLLVGGPEAISFAVQSQLDIKYAVGRIAFDTLQEYANYAANVVRYEDANATHGGNRRTVLFGPRIRGDLATQRSADYLIATMEKNWSPGGAFVQPVDWKIDVRTAGKADRASLIALLTGTDRTDLLFVATHGLETNPSNAQHRDIQGALICQDWPGPLLAPGPVVPKAYVAGSDIPDDADLTGLVSVFFGCYTGGEPPRDEFATHLSVDPLPARTPFVSRLAQRVLGHRRGGLAVIGHVERAWDWSFLSRPGGPQVGTLQSLLAATMGGERIGVAMEYLSERYAEETSLLTSAVESDKLGEGPGNARLATLWIRALDARNYMMFGDPAARLLCRDRHQAA